MKVTSKGRLIYIEPNDITGIVNGREVTLDNVFHNPEELNMSVDLQVVIPNRNDYGKMAINNGTEFMAQVNYGTISNADRYVSFMQGATIKGLNGSDSVDTKELGHELTTDYIDASYTEIYTDGKSNKEALGIESVDITFDQHFYPQVNIKFIDVRGYSLMMPSEGEYLAHEEMRKYQEEGGIMGERAKRLTNGGYSNFFRALFHFPYPKFLLTIKGFYGNSITFSLAVNEFRNELNSQTGNFEVNVSFIGYMYGLYTDLPLDLLIAAPYFGSNVDEGTKCSYWNDSNFKFDDGNASEGGPEMKTFVEFVEGCNKLNEDRDKVKSGESEWDSLNKQRDYEEDKRNLENILSLLRKFIEDSHTLNSNTNNYTDLYYDNSSNREFEHTNYVTCLSDPNSKITTFKIDITSWNNFATELNNYNRKNKTNGEDNSAPSGDEYQNSDNLRYFNDIFPNYRVNNTANSLVDVNNNQLRTFDVTDGNYVKEIDLVDYTTVVERHLDSFKHVYPIYEHIVNHISQLENKPQKVGALLFGSLVQKLINRINNINSKINENRVGVYNSVKSMFEKNLGFQPNILNMYRMIFAHVSCFMQEFYHLIEEDIPRIGEQRRIGNLRYDRQMTDVKDKMSQKAYLPPFPAIYREGDNGRREQVYPGEIEELRGIMPELDFIEKFINGVMGMKVNVNKARQEAVDNRTYREESISGGNSTTWTPTSMSDYGVSYNPYSAIEEGNVEDIVNTFILRYIMSCSQISNDKKKLGVEGCGKIEADNYIKLHKPTDKFIEQLNVQEDRIKDYLDKFLNTGKDKLFGKDNIQTNDNEIRIKTDSIPISFSKYGDKSTWTIWGERNNLPDSFSSVLNNASYVDNFKSRAGDGEVGDRTYNMPINDNRIVNPESITKEKLIPKTPKSIKEKWFFKKTKLSENPYINEFKNWNGENDDRAVCYFLLALCQSMYGNFDIFEKEGITHIHIMKQQCSNVTAISNATLYLLGCLLKDSQRSKPQFPKEAREDGKIDALYYFDGENYDKTEWDVEKIKGFDNDVSYSLIRENGYLRDKIISKFDDFRNGEEWRKIFNALIAESTYDGNGNFKTEYKDGEVDVRKLIYDYVVDINKLNFIFNLNLEFLYRSDDKDKKKGTLVLKRDTVLGEMKTFLTTLRDSYTKDGERRTNSSAESEFKKSDVTNAYRLALYNTLKNLYDKWAPSYNVKDFILRTPLQDREAKRRRYQDGCEYNDIERTEFDNFLFVDAFYNDISYRMRLNPITMAELLDNHFKGEFNYSTYQFMAELMQKNKMLFHALPVFNNYYSVDSIRKIFEPNIKQTLKRGLGSTYMCMYTYEVAHVVDDIRFDDHLATDSIADLNDIVGDKGPFRSHDVNSNSLEMNITVPAFAVTYAQQNQSYFKNIMVNMDNPRITDYSLANLFMLTNPYNSNDLNNPGVVSNDIYSIYANRSYNCSVEMLGCANIMPMMYFQLNNIPMFRGAYMITNVEHHIKAGDFTTKFSGVLVSKNQLPYDSNLFSLESIIGMDTYLEQPLTEGEAISDYTCDNNTSGTGKFINYVGFSVDAAVCQMGKQNICDNREKKRVEIIPIERSGKGSSSGCCAQCVRQFIEAGFNGANNKKDKDELLALPRKDAGDKYEHYPNGYQWRERGNESPITKIGFVQYREIKSNTYPSFNKNEWRAGDVAIMKKNGKNYSRDSIGHICMYNGQNWVSDFKQNSPYVYNPPVEIYFYRYGGKEVKTSTNTQQVNASTKSNGKTIMKELQAKYGFTDEQVIGIGSSLYQESNWQTTAVNENNKTYIPAGIAQWSKYGGRQNRVVDYINSLKQGEYRVLNSVDDKEGNVFINAPLGHHIKAIMHELDTSKRSVVPKIKEKNTSEWACYIWTTIYEGIEDKPKNKVDIEKHEKHIGLAREVFYSA